MEGGVRGWEWRSDSVRRLCGVRDGEVMFVAGPGAAAVSLLRASRWTRCTVCRSTAPRLPAAVSRPVAARRAGRRTPTVRCSAADGADEAAKNASASADAQREAAAAAAAAREGNGRTSTGGGDNDSAAAPWVTERLKVVLLSFASFVLCNMDRINVSVAILPMRNHFGWSQSTVGIVQSAFFWGYILTQIPGGYLTDQYGGKNVLNFGVIAWSLMTFVTPIAASWSLPVLLVARALLGVGEGVAMPAMNGMVSKWVPRQERSRSLSLIYSGMYLGSVFGLLSCPALIHVFGWQSVFYVFGSVGLVWAVLWQIGVDSTPQKSTRVSDRERAYITKNTVGSAPAQDGKAGKTSVPWRRLLSAPSVWAINVAHFCCTWGYFVFLTWLPTYFNQHLGFDIRSSAFLSVLPWMSMFLSANTGGVVADQLYKRGMSLTRVRKTMQTIGFLGPSLFLGAVALTNSPFVAVGCMTVALGLASFSQSGVYSNHQDIGPQYSGILLGISNTFAAIPGIVGVALTGFILDHFHSWDLVFAMAIGFYVIGTVVYDLFATGEEVF